MKTNLLIPANKKRLLAFVSGSLFLLAWMLMFTTPAFAIPCFDPNTGTYIDADPCPAGTTDDPGASPPPAAGGGSDPGGEITTFTGLLNRISTILNAIVPFLVGLGVFVIIYGIFGYIRHSAEEEKRIEARMFIVWGVVGVFMMLAIWGFVNILVNTFSLKRDAPVIKSVFPTSQ